MKPGDAPRVHLVCIHLLHKALISKALRSEHATMLCSAILCGTGTVTANSLTLIQVPPRGPQGRYLTTQYVYWQDHGSFSAQPPPGRRDELEAGSVPAYHEGLMDFR